MTRELLSTLVDVFFVAFGVIIGGAIIGSLGAFLVGKAPLDEMKNLASSLKIWAIVAAIGGSFDAITSIERGLFAGLHEDIFRTFMMLFTAFGGAQAGTVIILWIVGGEH
ncbi:YtrH family sporulation protein [Alkalihalobacillus pseudalcaliphilus]|uniref:YtrH family sporulation protein n=1 Tax=Alkalihalobacillus pseudalcaliphilus TaxID=79884 RepID=UPI00064E0A24|nr:YtrH family sporulation protein [Alkalihalobacillus pseudalcaliphilus]KMK74550.1 sporulation protein [Alkalihalobacillus pseudalcaliphilus]